jgi:hypothetical protein
MAERETVSNLGVDARVSAPPFGTTPALLVPEIGTWRSR